MRRFGIFVRLHVPEGENGGGNGSGNPPENPEGQKKEAPQFNPDDFLKQITETVNKAVNALDKKLTAVEKRIKSDEDTAKAEQERIKKEEEEKKKSNQSPEMNALELRIRELTAASDARTADLERQLKETAAEAEKKDRAYQVSTKLNGYKFRTATAMTDANQYFANVAVRDENGDLIANNLPLAKFIEQELGPNGSRAYMIAPVETSGSGAGKGNAQHGKPFDIDEIKPGMSKDDLKRVAAQIAALTPTQ